MNRRALALVLAAALVGAGGCADNQTSIELAQICAPTDTCTFSATCGAQSIGIAQIDTSLTNTLWLFVQVNNQTVNNADKSTFRANSHDAYIEEVLTEYVAPFAIGDTRQRVGPYLVPAGGSAVVSMFPITPQAAATIDAAGLGTTPVGIVAKMKASGHYQDQSAFETAAMEVAVDVCNGCFDPNPCTSGTPTAICPNFGQSPVAVKCE